MHMIFPARKQGRRHMSRVALRTICAHRLWYSPQVAFHIVVTCRLRAIWDLAPERRRLRPLTRTYIGYLSGLHGARGSVPVGITGNPDESLIACANGESGHPKAYPSRGPSKIAEVFAIRKVNENDVRHVYACTDALDADPGGYPRYESRFIHISYACVR